MCMFAVRWLQRCGVAQPDRLHTGLRSADDIGRMVVTHMQDLMRRATQVRGGGVKDARVGLGHASIAGADAA